ncbi:acyltransferase [Microbacterium sp. NPDC089987]|uniref:acyltransferase family protein n=1 Tax=Microbacterium sp. NPDC089987 TaxID=3364202 RepID=UPI0038033FCF
MTLTTPPPVATSHRDPAIDLVRALCIGAVVVLHSLMVGVTVTSSGPVFENAGDTGTWLVPVSWMLQVMPLFFVIGGFSGLTALRAARRRGADTSSFVVDRMRRLLIPAVVAVAAAGALLWTLQRADVAPALVEMAGYRYGQPLWFLGVFLLCQALLPAMAALHERAPLGTLAALTAAAAAVDVMGAVSGIDGIGFLNLVFVWFAMQQLGFVLADGRIDALGRGVRTGAAVAAAALLACSFTAGWFSPDLIANTNPPTTALILVGVIQTLLFSLLRPALSQVATRPLASAFTRFVSARAMTIYLWHMPVLLALAGLCALVAGATGIVLPAPDTTGWWLTRPVWLICALGVTALIALPLARMERVRLTRSSAPAAVTAAGVLLAAAAVVGLLVVGTSPVTAALAVGVWLVALALTAVPAPARAAATALESRLATA